MDDPTWLLPAQALASPFSSIAAEVSKHLNIWALWEIKSSKETVPKGALLDHLASDCLNSDQASWRFLFKMKYFKSFYIYPFIPGEPVKCAVLLIPEIPSCHLCYCSNGKYLTSFYILILLATSLF